VLHPSHLASTCLTNPELIHGFRAGCAEASSKAQPREDAESLVDNLSSRDVCLCVECRIPRREQRGLALVAFSHHAGAAASRPSASRVESAQIVE
jgi:hypothetical protein